jgi:hypothetical protein
MAIIIFQADTYKPLDTLLDFAMTVPYLLVSDTLDYC